jgi:hypothetical protein
MTDHGRMFEGAKSRKITAIDYIFLPALHVFPQWVVEHAKEVSRMMPGGLSVIGIYVFCPAEQVHDVSHHKIFYETGTETETRRVHVLALHGPCMYANSLSKFLCHNVLRSISFILFWAK